MKKILAALLVLALVAPAMADVAITTSDQGSGILRITITPSGTAAIRGVALVLDRTVGDATLAIPALPAVPAVTTTGLNTFIDYGFSYASGFDVGVGHPIATWNAAGVPVAGSYSKFAVCAGYLAPSGQLGQTTPIVFDVDYDLTANSTIAISLDTLRGGIVGDTLGTVTTLPISQNLAGAPPECVKSTAPFYADWVAYGKPSCWCFQRQCRGDADGTLAGPYWVNSVDLNSFKSAFNKTDAQLAAITNGICADFDHQAAGPYRVASTDLTIFKTYFNKTADLVPVCDVNNHNFWTN